MSELVKVLQDDIARVFGVPADYLRENYGEFQPSSELIPDELQVELISLREKKRDIYFRIGDIANELILMHRGTSSNNKIYQAMSQYCDSAPRTIRYYAETASFFPQDVRDQFDVLPFSHFDLARNYGEAWMHVLKIGANNPSWSRRKLERAINEYLKMQMMAEIKSIGKNRMCDSVRTDGRDVEVIELDNFPGKVEAQDVLTLDFKDFPIKVNMPAPPTPNAARLVGEIACLSEKVMQLLKRYQGDLPDEVIEGMTGHVVGINGYLPAITSALDENGAK
jgi:hypothetical protein